MQEPAVAGPQLTAVEEDNLKAHQQAWVVLAPSEAGPLAAILMASVMEHITRVERVVRTEAAAAFVVVASWVVMAITSLAAVRAQPEVCCYNPSCCVSARLFFLNN